MIVKTSPMNRLPALIRNNDGWTALMLAVRGGHGDIVQYLHQAGADINIKSNEGWTAVMVAASEGHGDIVRYLSAAAGAVE